MGRSSNIIQSISEYNQFIDEILIKNNASPHLLCCEQLSRNNWTTKVFENLSKDSPHEFPTLPLIRTFTSLARYYVANLRELYLIIWSYLVCKIITNETKVSHCIVQVFAIESKVKSSNFFNDTYFTNLPDHLSKTGRDYTYIPFLITDSYSPLYRYRTIKAFRSKKSLPNILEFDLISLTDLAKLISFIFTYPLAHYSLLQFKKKGSLGKLFNNELLCNIHETRISSYLKYLVASQLTKKLPNNSLILNWYENQICHKLFIKGLKKTSTPPKIHGAQLLLFPRTMLNYYPTQAEQDLNLTPDRIFYNGRYFLEDAPDFIKSKSEVGPSLRYSKLFSSNVANFLHASNGNILIAFSYSLEHSRELAKNCTRALKDMPNILSRLHPATLSHSSKIGLSNSWKSSSDELYKEFEKCWLLITSGSGTAVEAMSCGLSVIIIGSRDLSASYLPNYGYGEIWHYADNEIELKQAIEKLSNHRSNNEDRIKALAKRCREEMFNQPNFEGLESLLK